jgi:uncharacterized membrane protein YdbT with pleckstrin-like domain
VTETNGRIKLTWGQVSWCMAVLVVLISGWFRIEYRLTQLETTVREGVYSKGAIDEMRRDADREHGRLSERLNAVERQTTP